jgi:hypothetical protein
MCRKESRTICWQQNLGTHPIAHGLKWVKPIWVPMGIVRGSGRLTYCPAAKVKIEHSRTAGTWVSAADLAAT